MNELTLPSTGSFHKRPAASRPAGWLLSVLSVCLIHAFAADGFSQQSPSTLRWGGDMEGGGPYIFPQDDDPTKVTGFEVDLAAALGRHLHRPVEFVQCSWPQILPVLDRGNIELAINGYEYSAERASRYLASLPYYIYELGLCARKDDKSLTSWDSLKQPTADGHKRRIGVLEESAGDRYVTKKFGKECEIVRYEGSTEALRLVESGQLDATVQDLPAIQFYVEQLKRYPGLAIVGEPTAAGYYVIYVRPGEDKLIAEVNEALKVMYHNHEMQAIYERYGIWNDTQEQLPDVWANWHSVLKDRPTSKWVDLRRQIPLLFKAASITIALALLSMPLAMSIGLTAALCRAWKTPTLGGGGDNESLRSRIASGICSVYVEVVRGTPLAFQLYVVYFVLPEVVGLRIGEFWSGVIALAVNYSAYEAEIFRLGLQAIPKGQMEAALSLGMSRAQAVRRIILPQAVRLVIPASANDFIALFKDTAVCSVIAVEELSKQYSMGAKSTGLFLEMAALASLLYLAMSYPLSLLAAWLEQRLKR